jgi:ribonuclease P protein component
MTSESLPKSIIIRHAHDFQRLFQNGKRLSGKFVHLIYLPLGAREEDDVFVRFGFACGKKIGGAVQRNYYKRLMREMARKNRDRFAGFEALIVAQPAIVQANYETLREDILNLARSLAR